MPQARDVTYDEVISGNEIGQWVAIRGVVRNAHIDTEQKPPRLLLDIAASGAKFRAWLLEFAPEDVERLVDAQVRLVGVPVALSNNDGKIFNFRMLMSKRSDVAVEHPPQADPYETAPVSIKNLRQPRPGAEVEHRVHVRGTVAGWQPGQWLALVDGIGALQIRTEQKEPNLRPGELVDVIGFPARGDYGAILEDAVFRRSGETEAAPVPLPVTAPAALKNDSRLISIEATLLGVVRRADAFLLSLQAEGALFEANLAWESSAPPWPDLEPGSLVRITGICTVSAGDDIRYLKDLNPQSFRVALRDRADLAVLRRPPWLTAPRAETLLAALAAGTLLLYRHYRSLREQIRARIEAEHALKQAHGELEVRVEERSRQIEKEISARREAEGALRERNRLATEIHDSLQQGLTALSAQLAIAGETIATRPEAARASLDQARALVRHNQEEMRRTVRNLRSQFLERHALGEALEELSRAALIDQDIALEVSREGQALDLPEVVQDHLLRIGQETITNALKHGHPRKIEIRLTFRSRSVSLAITDDGCGFCPDAAPGQEAGHFGLIGMRERIQRLGGTFVLDSAPGAGTKIAVVVPLAALPVMQD